MAKDYFSNLTVSFKDQSLIESNGKKKINDETIMMQDVFTNINL